MGDTDPLGRSDIPPATIGEAVMGFLNELAKHPPAIHFTDPIVDTPQGPMFSHELEDQVGCTGCGEGVREIVVKPESLSAMSEPGPSGQALMAAFDDAVDRATERMLRITERDMLLTVLPIVKLHVEIDRTGRAKCGMCRRRRLLYAIFVSARSGATRLGSGTIPLCAECMGIRP